MDKHTISFSHAIHGLVSAFVSQPNLRIHTLLTTFVVVAGFIFRLSPIEWAVLALTIALVVTAELINTAVESSCNAITREQNQDIGQAKDVAAGAVLLSALFSVIIGLIIFLPKIQQLITTSYH